MKNRNHVILLSAVIIIATNGLFAQQEKSTSTIFQEDIEKLMLEKNVPALGVGIIEDGVVRQIRVYGVLKKKILLLPTMQSLI